MNYGGEFFLPAENMVAEKIVENELQICLEDLYFKNPKLFVGDGVG